MAPTSSPLEGLRKMTKLVNHLMSRQDASPFCEPVAWRELELWDYPKIVTKMMDLGTVKRKLERNAYANSYECALDVRLVWSNCQTYNSDGSDFWLLAKSLSRRFEDRYKKLKSECKSLPVRGGGT
jgi:Bromodomain